jgi:DNA replication protein DnaC
MMWAQRPQALRQPHHKTINEFDFAFQSDLDARKVRDLTFVTEKSNVALLGPPGVGKTL